MQISIIGCGVIAHEHFNAWQKNGCEVVSVYDLNQKAKQEFAEKYEITAAESIDVILAAKPDAVSICTPPGTHFELAGTFVKAGIPVLCEKPLAATLKQAEALAKEVDGSDVPFMVGFCHRWHPAIIKLKELMDSGKLGQTIFIRNVFSGAMNLAGDHRANIELSGGGTLIDTCSHSIDLFRHLAGEIDGVVAAAETVAQDIAVEDFANLTLRSGKIHGDIFACHSVGVGMANLEVHGTNGMAVVTYFSADEPDLKHRLVGDEKWTEVDCSDLPDRFAGEVAAFIESIKGEANQMCTVEDGLRVSKVIDNAYKSAKDFAN
jgi:predicted dehydrogenase